MTQDDTHRIGDWMQLQSGMRYWPLDPRPDDFCIEDIAHALSNICRWGGHVDKFYSVAQHSVLVAAQARKGLQMEALLHDAAEAYTGDIPRPLKRAMGNDAVSLRSYSTIEAATHKAICVKFGVNPVMADEIKQIDDRITVDERLSLFSNLHREEDWMFRNSERIGIAIRPIPPQAARELFMTAYRIIVSGLTLNGRMLAKAEGLIGSGDYA